MDNPFAMTVSEKAARIAPALRMLAAGGARPLPRVVFVPETAGEDRDPSRGFGLPADRLAGAVDPVSVLQEVFRTESLPGTDTEPVYRWAGVGAFHFQTVPPAGRRLEGRIAIVTGAAQGFGRGIADELAAMGAYCVLADLNYDAACRAAAEICGLHGDGRALALPVDVGSELSVAAMVESTVLAFGGVDLLVSNAGILRAGGLEDMTLEDFERVTRVNYTAFFLCAKYASLPMKTAARIDPGFFTDIIQINSKSGLQGSNRNFAYAGGKFGGIGLVQSFALELAPHRIKVNAVCPGNFFEGPLWSDPENGLFIQYLRAGKVPGAKTVQDVFASYTAKVPMGRGCRPADVARAICYLVEQEYETGQALPVTGGQVMLH